jgi:hypothetical protein
LVRELERSAIFLVSMAARETKGSREKILLAISGFVIFLTWRKE